MAGLVIAGVKTLVAAGTAAASAAASPVAAGLMTAGSLGMTAYGMSQKPGGGKVGAPAKSLIGEVRSDDVKEAARKRKKIALLTGDITEPKLGKTGLTPTKLGH